MRERVTQLTVCPLQLVNCHRLSKNGNKQAFAKWNIGIGMAFSKI